MQRLMFPVLLLLFLSFGALCPGACRAAEAPVTLGVTAEQFQFYGDWQLQTGIKGSHERGCLFAGGQGAKLPAVTALSLPRAGRYYLWVRALDFPEDRPGIRRFTVSVGGQRSPETFGDSGKPGWMWEPGGAFELPAGPVLLGIHDVDHFYARVDAVLLTTDKAFTPSQPLGKPRHPRTTPLPLTAPEAVDPFQAQPLHAAEGAPLARLENEFTRIEFLPATRGNQATVCPRVQIKRADQWQDAGADANAEAYVVVASKDPKLHYSGFYPTWEGAPGRTFTVTAGGASLETASHTPEAIWDAGEISRFQPRSATRQGNRVHLEFYPAPIGRLAADWELRPGERAARVQLSFTPASDGSFALGYQLFLRKPLDQVAELLLPMMWQRRRLPARPYTLLQPFTPTPIALAQTGSGEAPLSWAVIGDPAEIPFAWPNRNDPRFGLMIRDWLGNVQPAIYGPVPGTDAARARAGKPVRFAFRALVQPGDWYAGFRTAADGVFGLRDYRTNVGVSLTDAALNMIDLVMDDEHGGWWERAKGPYQIETQNGATHASPLTALSLYRLTGDPEIYRRRALPTMEYVLSRGNAHFSPTPENTGATYPAGNMNGPVSLFGSTVFGGFWEATHQRTSAFRQFALPDNGVRPTAGYSHGQEFEEWLARYLLTKEPTALQQARALADKYLKEQIQAPPATEISPVPFFNLSFVPDWEGLLRLYEVTGDRRYLDGAVFGARQLMTGIWTQPVIPDGEITVHPGGNYRGCVPERQWWKGPVKYQLGFPRKAGDTPEHRVPAWIVSNVGQGFEQPITYTAADTGGRLIYQAAWAPNFLRLAAYTGDRTFETYARNAVLGRWANYPGYYVTGFTDMPLNPRYPIQGPDVSCIYYHHILPHLSWTIDYLVAEAALRSGGEIRFPSERQFGYAWFDSRVYGHAPGTIYGETGAWLWLRRGLVTLDNPALNYLTAHSTRQFHLVLMNENRQEEKAKVSFNAQALGFDPGAVKEVAVRRNGVPAAALPLRNGQTTVTVPGRGLVALTLSGTRITAPGHAQPDAVKAGEYPGYVTAQSAAGPEARAAAIQVDPGSWDAYVWCSAAPGAVRRVSLHYATGGAWQQIEDREYPFEFSVPVAKSVMPFRFRLEGETAGGKPFATAEATIGVPRP